MPPPGKSGRSRPPKGLDGDDAPSLNLWVGDLSSETLDSDLMAIFGDYGAMDALTSYVPRTYAFVFFRTVDDAKKAKEGLQGSVVRGSSIKIEFARLAKPGKYMWIGGISSAVSEEQLEDELLQFGKLEEYRFLRDRNSALVGYCKLDDAIAAHKNLNGKVIGGQQIRVDYQKPQSSRRDRADNHNSQGGRRNAGQETFLSPDEIRNHQEPPKVGCRRYLPHGGRRDGPPSNTLWVGYPPSVRVPQPLLHNAMILFGEIERITSFPARHYSFVEFRSVDEARRAKEGLQGRLFGDPRIQILFSCSNLATGKENAPLLPGYRGSHPEMLLTEAPFGAVESFGSSRPLASNSFPGQFLHNRPAPNGIMRSQGFDPQQGDMDFHDYGMSVPNFLDGNPNGPAWRRLSPSPAGHSPSLGIQTNVWDEGYDLREPKRSRLNDSPSNDSPIYRRRMGGEGSGSFGLPEREIPGQSHLNATVRGSGRLRSPDIKHFWRGVIAKGGTDVCHARCVALGDGLQSPLPEKVNCFAKTDLDMLAKHYAEAVGFDIVFFIPDSEEDFPWYTDFLRYLGLKNRVGVAKCEDGTTLFLVPPSDFLTNVLKVLGPKRLYGIVLKFSHQSTNHVQRPQAAHLPPPHYSERPQESDLRDRYNYVPANEDPGLRTDGLASHENSVSQAAVGHDKQAYPVTSEPNNYTRNPVATSKVGGVSLTPELIATLTTLLPTNSQSLIAGVNNIPGSSVPSSMGGPRLSNQGWIQDYQTAFPTPQVELRGNAQQQQQAPQLGGQYDIHAPATFQIPTSTSFLNGPDNSVHSIQDGAQGYGHPSNVPQSSATPARHLESFGPSDGQLTVSSNQHHQQDSSFNSYNARGDLQGAHSISMLNQTLKQQMTPSSSSSHAQSANILDSRNSSGTDFLAQSQHVPNNRSSDGTAQEDAEKNQRYQKTLQIAANLLQNIRQRQQGNNQATGGSGN